MLDPFSALAIATAVVQFVDFTKDIVSKGKEIYKSTSGTVYENEGTETATERLLNLTLEINKARKKARHTKQICPPSPVPWVAEESEDAIELRERQDQQRREQQDYIQRTKEDNELESGLEAICAECKAVSEELLNHLRDIKVPNGKEHRQFKSFRHALKSVWSKNGVDDLFRRLSTLRAQLDTHVLFLLRHNVKAISITQDTRFLKLTTDIQDIVPSLLATQLEQNENLRKHFDALSESQKREHAQTRAAFVYSDGQKRKTRVQLILLESLRFPMMHDRYEKLARAHEKTFLWIFKDPQRHQKPWDNFTEWLSTSGGTYWIQGKAACGKSTLMRYVWNNPQTLKYLKQWTRGGSLAVGAFFFWNSGIPDQRSQSGLLRSLLYETLKNQTNLIPEILPEQWEKASALAAHDLQITLEEWTLSQLKRAFKKLILHANQSLKLCFFIDGLDEYDGNPKDISQFFLELSELTSHAKFCVSSRPWPDFQDIYEGVPGMRLQDLTRDDITLFVRDEIRKSKQMKSMLLTDAKSFHDLLEELVEKAAGVFLWVTLVVKSLVNGLGNGDNISHLRRRLASLPNDLEKLYGHMLDQIDKLDREEASKIFQIFHTSGHSLDVPTLERALRYPKLCDTDQYRDQENDTATQQSDEGSAGGSTHRNNAFPEQKVVDCGNMSLPRTSLPFATVWFNAWVACGSGVDSNDSTYLNAYPEDDSEIPGHHQQLKGIQASQHQALFTKNYPTPQWDTYWEGLTHDSLSDPPIPAKCEKAVDFNGLDMPKSPGLSSRSSKSVLELEKSYQLHKIRSRVERLASYLGDHDPRYSNACWKGPTDDEWQPDPDETPQCEIEQGADFDGPDALQNSDLGTGDASSVDDASNTEFDTDFLQISYLHRTVRDYLEQETIWSDLVKETKETDFDPKTALLAADILELKTTGRVSDSTSVFAGGMEAVARVGRLAPLNSETQLILLEEFGRALGAHWVGERVRTKGDKSKTCYQEQQGDMVDILSSIMLSALRWYIDTKFVAVDLPLRYSPSSALLAYALGLEFWCVGETIRRTPTPDYNMVETILCMGCNPNATYKGYSIWEYTISYIHILNEMEETRESNFRNLTPWMRLCQLLLEHGANPNVCCVKGYHCWWLKIQSSPLQDSEQRTFDPNKEDLENLGIFDQNRPKLCSVTSVFAQVFERKFPLQGAQMLRAVLESKKFGVGDMIGGNRGKKRKRRKTKNRIYGC